VLFSDERVVALDTSSMELKDLGVRGDNPRYMDGFLFYTQGDTLVAARFDPESLSLQSTPVPVLTGLRTEIYGYSQWALASNGTLLYAPGISAAESPLIWVDDNGSEALQLPRRQKGTFEISPDGKQLLVAEFRASSTDLWLYDLVSGASRKLTSEPDVVSSPLNWLPDSRRIVYHRRAETGRVPFMMSLDSGKPGEPLVEDQEQTFIAWSISANGRYIGALKNPPQPTPPGAEAPPEQIAIIDLQENREITIPLVGTGNWGMAVSPNGDAVVYTSSVSGEYQNYLQPVPPTGARYQISRLGGAEEPRWSRDGSKIYYRNGLRIMVVDVQLSPKIVLGEPRVFYEGNFVNVGGRSYDISPDGKRALIIEGRKDTAHSIRMITNWLSRVEQVVGE
jgi:dipeptidyl aminopeptidase/acylaminoacyl peptidase